MGFFNRVKYDELSLDIIYFEIQLDIKGISQQRNFFQEAVRVYGLSLGDELENVFWVDYGNYRQQVENNGELSIQYNIIPDTITNSSVIAFKLKLPKSENYNNEDTLNRIFFIFTMLVTKWGNNTGAFKYGNNEWQYKFWNLVPDDFRETVGNYIYGDEW